MDRRVFQPRPNGSDARRRSAIGMAAIVLMAAWLWTQVSHGAVGPASAPARTPGDVNAGGISSAPHNH